MLLRCTVPRSLQLLCRSKHSLSRQCSPTFLLGHSERKVALYSLAEEEDGSTSSTSLQTHLSTCTTYGELNALSDAAASDMRALLKLQEGFPWSHLSSSHRPLPLPPGQDVAERFGWQPRVALLCSNNSSFVSALWTVWKVGAVAVPLCNTHPPEEQLYVLKDSGAAGILSSPDLKDRAQSLGETAQIQHYPLSANPPRSPAPSPPVDSEVLDYSDLAALMLYTSGTTGRPKGVLTTHGNVSAQVSMLLNAWAWSSDDVILHALPLHHLHGVVNALLCPLAAGATIVMATRFNAKKVWDALVHKEQGTRPPVNVFMGVPTMYAKLVEYSQGNLTSAERERAKEHLQGTLRLMVSGSASLPLNLFKQWKDLSGHSLLERYGMTEVGMALSNPLHGQRIPGSVGFPLASVSARIVETTTPGEEVDGGGAVGGDRTREGRQGELQLIGPAVFQGGLQNGCCDFHSTYDSTLNVDLTFGAEAVNMNGLGPMLMAPSEVNVQRYWGRSEETAEAFTADGWFKTGDVAACRSDRYSILGRASTDIIKYGGFKISALEIEHVLLDHPDVKECAVIGVPDDVYGERVGAIIVPKDDKQIGSLSLPTVKDYCSDHLAKYKLPQRVWLVPELPRNAMGKVNKKQLLKHILEQCK